MLRDGITSLIEDNRAERKERKARLSEERNTRKQENDQRLRLMERMVKLGRGFGESMVRPMSHPTPNIFQ